MKKQLLLLLILFPLSGFAKTMVFTPPTEREDNTPLDRSEISGYKVYVYQDGLLYKQFSIENVTAFDIQYPEGQYSIIMKTVDADNRVSVSSERVKVNFVTANPEPPVLQ